MLAEPRAEPMLAEPMAESMAEPMVHAARDARETAGQRDVDDADAVDRGAGARGGDARGADALGGDDAQARRDSSGSQLLRWVMAYVARDAREAACRQGADGQCVDARGRMLEVRTLGMRQLEAGSGTCDASCDASVACMHRSAHG